MALLVVVRSVLRAFDSAGVAKDNKGVARHIKGIDKRVVRVDNVGMGTWKVFMLGNEPGGSFAFI